ncbi:Bidirectional sugar transporter SWEET10 [Tripterygium wilfordii]|uniref:Bidirectional sugar transporter SWEET10 n=2 Tax=Tripterygium wilfordii TaxID=458696 RepID=A0A7J7CDM2_TRIWF|nr:Bidirectional sugar transporter SWEET10 [Tripterygium wilfordii]
MAQMSLYGMYRNYKKKLPTAAEVEPKLQELSEQIVDVVKLSAMVCSHDLIITPAMINFNMGTEKAEDDKDVIKEETKV